MANTPDILEKQEKITKIYLELEKKKGKEFEKFIFEKLNLTFSLANLVDLPNFYRKKEAIKKLGELLSKNPNCTIPIEKMDRDFLENIGILAAMPYIACLVCNHDLLVENFEETRKSFVWPTLTAMSLGRELDAIEVSAKYFYDLSKK